MLDKLKLQKVCKVQPKYMYSDAITYSYAAANEHFHAHYLQYLQPDFILTRKFILKKKPLSPL